MQRELNLKYATSNFFYFTLFGTMFAFVSIFLLDKGFDNTTIGLTLGLTSVSSVGLQTFLGNYVDKHEHIKLQDVMSIVTGIVIGAAALLFFLESGWLFLLLVVLSFSLTQSLTPLLNSMAFLYDDFGIVINYGFARGIGSFSYALVTIILGFVLDRISPGNLPLFYLLFGSLLFLTIRSYTLSATDQQELEDNQSEHKRTKKTIISEKSLIDFIKEHQKLFFLMIGVAFLFYGHIMINNFFIQVITPIGGTSQTMGIAIFIGTILELPAMMNFKGLANRIPVHHLLKISAVFFLVKHLLTYLAPNMFVIYLAQAVQIGAFSVAYPALVQYTQTVIASEDLVKGQSLLASSIGFSNIVASFTGGILLDKVGASGTMFIAVVTTIIGLIIVFMTVEDHSQEQSFI